MSLFTSRRERSLWLGALGVVLLIYSTLGVARVIVEALRERNLLRITVAVTFGVSALLIAWLLARRRPGRNELAVAVGFAALYTVVLALMERSEERLHILEYGVVAVLILRALEERCRNGKPPPVAPGLLAVLATAALGWLDEGIQEILPSRYYDIRDVALNAAAGVLAVAATMMLARARARDRAP